MDTSKRVEKIIQQTFNTSVEIKEHFTPHDVPGWNSLGHLNLILELEREFGIRFSDEDMLQLDSVASINRILSGYLK